MGTMSFFFPASVSLFAIYRHWYLMEAREYRKETLKKTQPGRQCCMSTPPNAQVVEYSGGSYCTHFFCTLTVWVIIVILFVIALSNLGTRLRPVIRDICGCPPDKDICRCDPFESWSREYV